MPQLDRKTKVRLADRIYFAAEQIGRRSLVIKDEFLLSVHPFLRLRRSFGHFYFSLIAVLNRRSVGKFGGLIGFLKLLVLIPLIVVAFCVLYFFTMLAGSISTILGFRNRGEYTVAEQFAAWVLPALLILTLPFFASDLILYWFSNIMTYGILLIGIDILIGHCGLPTLGHAGFVAIGAYVTAWLYGGTFGFSLPFVAAVPAGGLVGASLGALLALPAIRIKDHHLAVVTLTFGLMVPLALKCKYLAEISGVSAGGLSIAPPQRPAFLEWMKPQVFQYFIISFFFVTLVYFAYNIIRQSQLGRAFQAVRCDIEVAGILGVPVIKFKLLAFSLSAFYASVAGGLFVLKTGFISAEFFSMQESILYCVANVLGGATSILGSIAGAVFLTFEPEIGRKLAAFVPRGAQLVYAITGMLMILMVYFAPRGIAGAIVSIVRSRYPTRVRRGANYLSPPSDYDVIAARGLPSTSLRTSKDLHE